MAVMLKQELPLANGWRLLFVCGYALLFAASAVVVAAVFRLGWVTQHCAAVVHCLTEVYGRLPCADAHLYGASTAHPCEAVGLR